MKASFVNLTKYALMMCVCVMSTYNQCNSTQVHFTGKNVDNVSSRESNNWFHVDTQKWNYMKYLHFQTRNNQMPSKGRYNRDFGKYMNFNWIPDFNCPVPPLRIGLGDGGKVICDPDRLNKEECIVYSIGSFGNFKFEQEILKINPNCEIHTFDHTYSPKEEDKKWTNYHEIGLGTETKGKISTLIDIVNELNHTNHRISILKVIFKIHNLNKKVDV